MEKSLAIVLSLVLVLASMSSLTAFAGEQLGQNTFDDGVGIPWHICESGPAKLDFNIDGGTYNITIKNPGGAARGGESRWDCQLRHRNLTIIAGHSYTVKFEVTPSNSGQLYTKIGDLSGDIEVWHNACDDSSFDSCWDPINVYANQTYRCNTTFTAKQTVNVAEWAFHFGGAGNWQPTDCFPVGTVLKFDNLYLIDNTSSENDFIPEAKYVRNNILVNQVGYYPTLSKVATLVVDEDDMTAKTFEVRNSSGEAVYTGTTSPVGFDADSGDWVHKIDFTNFTTEGNGYYLTCKNDKSYSFNIGNNIYDGLVTDAMNYYYQNRSGVPILSQYITSGDKNSLAHQAGHSTDTAYVQSEWVKSYASDGSNVERSKTQNVTGGWYDAGDHGKYVVNGGISVWMLNNLFERSMLSGNTAKWEDNSGTVVIPENGNSYPDILDEARYETEWFMTMLVKDGAYKDMVYHKMHDHKWTGLAVKPWDYEDEWKTIRIIKPASTAATLNFVACAAQSYRVWKDYDPEFAQTCLNQAKISYNAAKAHPNMYAPLDQAIGGGAYGDDDVTDDFYWAACELFASTGDTAYYNDLKSYSGAFKLTSNLNGGENSGSCTSFNWGNTAGLGSVTLYLNCKNMISDNEYSQITDSIIDCADKYIGIENEQGYGIPYVGTTFTDEVNLGAGVSVDGYEWGSNSMVVNNAVVMAYAYDITKNPEYASGATRAMDYIFGTNPLEYSYVTGYGEHAFENPHHRYWSHQLDDSFPMSPAGVLSGGPNSGMQDPYILGAGYKRGEVAPQICYVDNVESWSTNEVTINWNAPLVWMASWMEDTANNVEFVPVEKPTDTETDTDTTTDTATEKDTETDTDTTTDTATEKDTETDTDTTTDTATEKDTETDTDTATDTSTDTDTDTDTDNYLLGDVNLDGVIDIIDVVLTRSHIIGSRGLEAIDSKATERADMNIDGEIDIIDVALMRKIIINGK